ncbi:MAG: Zn-ribbon domain-containing OB-fold protein [Acidimicrobiales bacterium]
MATRKTARAQQPRGSRSKARRQVPLVDYLRLGQRPHLRARECCACGARYFDRRNACARCGKADFRNTRVRNRGRVRSFTIVHRAAPGIPAPYVSAIVETEDGTSVRSNVVNCEATPETVTLGMKVKLVTYPIGVDDEGTEAVAFGYEPL